MGFRENLQKKIQINELTDVVLHSWGPPESGRRIDRQAMRRLLELGDYRYEKVRDLDLYILNESEILVLDNELKIYHTGADDIALRKSPTVKEMVSIRNAIKILNDKDVVVSRKTDTLERIQRDMISGLDLSFTTADIDALAKDGADALENKYAEGVIEILTLFAELLEYQKAPKEFQLAHHNIWGKLTRPKAGEWLFGPLVLFSMMDNSLKMLKESISSLNKERLQQYQQTARSGDAADLSGDKVWTALKNAVIKKKPE